MKESKVHTLVIQCSLVGVIEQVIYSDLDLSVPCGLPVDILIVQDEKESARSFIRSVSSLCFAEFLPLRLCLSGVVFAFRFSGFRYGDKLLLTGVGIKDENFTTEQTLATQEVNFQIKTPFVSEVGLCQAITTLVPVGVVVFGTDGVIVEWNKKATEILGYDKTEAVGKVFWQFLFSEKQRHTSGNTLEGFCTGNLKDDFAETSHVELVQTKSGNLLKLEFTFTPVWVKSKQLVCAFIRDIGGQEKTKQALIEENRQILEISDSIPGVVFQFLRTADKRYSFNFYSDKIEEITGITADQVYKDINMAWRSVHPDDLPKLISSIEKSAAELSKWALLYRIVTPDGKTRYIQGASQPTAHPDGSITWNGAFLDVTETVLAEKRAKLSESHFRMLLESLKEGVLHLDKDCRIVYANPQMSTYTGYTTEEMIGQDPADLFRVFEDDPETRSHHLIVRTDEKNNISEIAAIKKNGERIWLSRKITTILDENGEVASIIASHRDITAQKIANQNIEQSEKLYRALFQSSPLPMWVYCCKTLRFLAVNRAAIGHYKYSEDEFLSKTILDIRPEEDKSKLSQTLSGKRGSQVNTITSRHLKKNGELIDVLITGCPFDYEGKSSVLVVAQDISEQLKAEADRSRLISIIEATSDIVGVFDIKGNGIFINSAGCRFLKLKPEGFETEEDTFRKLNIRNLLKPDLLDDVLIHGSWSGELSLRDSAGLEMPVSVVVMAHKNWRGELQYYSLNARDISDVKASHQAVQTSEARYKSLFEQSPIPKFSLNTNGDLISANEAFKKLLPAITNTNKTLSFVDIFDIELQNQAKARLQQVLDGTAQTYNAVLADKHHNRLIVNITLTPIVVNEIIEGAYGMLQDETNLFYTTQELQESQRELRELTARIQVAQEEERKYIAREIHDELGQILTALNIDVTLLTKKVVAMVDQDKARELHNDLEELKKISKEAIYSVKRIVSELRPIAIDELGLSSELSLYLERFRVRYGIETTLNVPEEPLPLNAKQAIEVFRIIQEALTNVARHSHATRVIVEIKQLPDIISVMVKDDGVGIQKSIPVNGKSFGLIGMRERTMSIGGKYKLDSVPDQGTTVYLELPICPLAINKEALVQSQS